MTRWLLSLGRDSQLDTELILVYTSWHWVASDTELLCTGAQQVVGGGIGFETLGIIVIFVRGNLILFLQKTQLHASQAFWGALEPGAKWPTYYGWTLQRIYTASLWHHRDTIHFKRLRFWLKWGLNSIAWDSCKAFLEWFMIVLNHF